MNCYAEQSAEEQRSVRRAQRTVRDGTEQKELRYGKRWTNWSCTQSAEDGTVRYGTGQTDKCAHSPEIGRKVGYHKVCIRPCQRHINRRYCQGQSPSKSTLKCALEPPQSSNLPSQACSASPEYVLQLSQSIKSSPSLIPVLWPLV